MSREKDAEKIKLTKMVRELEELREEIEKIARLMKNAKKDERNKFLQKYENKKIKLALLRNKIARQKIKLSKMK